MKYYVLLSLFLCFSSITFCQFSKEFKKIDASKSYKNVQFGCLLVDAKKKMGLTPIKGTGGFQFSISNKAFLSIDKFVFDKGEAGFLFNKLKLIALESNRSDEPYFQEILKYLNGYIRESQFIDGAYYWVGENIGYSLFRNSTNTHIVVTISSMNN